MRRATLTLRKSRFAALFLALVVANARATVGEKPKAHDAEAAPSDDSYQRICDDYLSGNWQDLEPLLRNGKALAGLSAEQRAELAGCPQSRHRRPAALVAGTCGRSAAEGCFSRAVVLGPTRLDMRFEPGDKSGVRDELHRQPDISLTVSWTAADMDNPQHAEHGFSKGDLADLGVWSTLGMARCWSQLAPLRAVAGLSEEGKAGDAPLPGLSRQRDGCSTTARPSRAGANPLPPGVELKKYAQ